MRILILLLALQATQAPKPVTLPAPTPAQVAEIKSLKSEYQKAVEQQNHKQADFIHHRLWLLCKKVDCQNVK